MVSISQRSFAGVQKLGRALMLPIAVMPIAGLMLRLGQEDMLNIPFVAAGGDAIFSNLGILFAVGVAIGFAKESAGAAGLAGAVGYFVTIKSAASLVKVPPSVVAGLTGAAKDLASLKFASGLQSTISIPVGLLAGLIAGWMYNNFKDIKLPDYLAFFGGRRFVPIITGFACLALGLAFGFGWPYVTAGLDSMSRSVIESGHVGEFIYGFLNRILLVTGLHHIINNVAWLLIGNYNGVTGDLSRFFAGDPSAGAFMTGFFPVMMFGLPAACLAMYRSARKENRRLVGGVLLSMALTSFLTGVTEPIEFAFMFLAPLLYLVHAVLTGVALVIMSLLNVKLGFTFSAGLFDYVISFNKGTNPLLLLPIGAIYFVVYYGMFRIVITKFNLLTLGREPEVSGQAMQSLVEGVRPVQVPVSVPGAVIEPGPGGLPATARGSMQIPPVGGPPTRGLSYLAALGGAANVLEIEACATRLRLSLVDNGRLDEAALKQLGVRGVLRLTAGSAQIIIGPLADQVAVEIQDAMKSPGSSASA